jgi:peptidoglycan hydrolase FlgJ
MSSIHPVTMLPAGAGASSTSRKTSTKLDDAAQQFESLMIGELLKSSREAGSSGGWLGTGEEDQAGETAVDMAEQQFASVMAKQGGIGLTKFITHSLTPQSGTTPHKL